MESQHRAFHSSLEISQKTRDFHIPTAPATGCFTGTKKESKRKKTEGRLHKSLYTAFELGCLDLFLSCMLLFFLSFCPSEFSTEKYLWGPHFGSRSP